MRWVQRCSIMVACALGGIACSAAPDLEAEGSSADELQCNTGNAAKLASIAKRMDGQRSQHLCYRYVKAHLRGAGFPTATLESQGYGGSAFKFAVWAKKFPSALAKMGLKKVTLGLNELPKGAVIVWRAGQCGYSAQHGHIEVVVDDKSSRACSDFCGNIKKNCGAPDIFVPSGCITSPSSEGDDDDTSEPAPTEEGEDVPLPPKRPADPAPPSNPGEPNEPADPDEPATPNPPAPAGGCYSPTLEEQMPAGSCVQSDANNVWFQCNAGKWYRGVTGSTGPYGKCNGMHPL